MRATSSTSCSANGSHCSKALTTNAAGSKAAAAGYPMALNNIGGMYEGGQGAPVNYPEAARWYRKSVDAGEPIAMVDLGWLYETAHGVD